MPVHNYNSSLILVGVGTFAATTTFDRLRGRWEVPLILPKNEPSNAFWNKVVSEYTAGNFDEGTLFYNEEKCLDTYSTIA